MHFLFRTLENKLKKKIIYCGKSGKVSGMHCGKFIARWRQLYTRLPLPLPLIHIGWYHGSTHTDTNLFFWSGPQIKSVASHSSLSHIATAAAALLLLHGHRCRRSAFSSPPSCRYWFFFSTATPSYSPLLLLVLLLLFYFFFFFFCAIWVWWFIYIYIYI